MGLILLQNLIALLVYYLRPVSVYEDTRGQTVIFDHIWHMSKLTFLGKMISLYLWAKLSEGISFFAGDNVLTLFPMFCNQILQSVCRPAQPTYHWEFLKMSISWPNIVQLSLDFAYRSIQMFENYFFFFEYEYAKKWPKFLWKIAKLIKIQKVDIHVFRHNQFDLQTTLGINSHISLNKKRSFFSIFGHNLLFLAIF